MVYTDGIKGLHRYGGLSWNTPQVEFHSVAGTHAKLRSIIIIVSSTVAIERIYTWQLENR